jgi:hypothetical protein
MFAINVRGVSLMIVAPPMATIHGEHGNAFVSTLFAFVRLFVLFACIAHVIKRQRHLPDDCCAL